MKLSLYNGRFGYSITVNDCVAYAERNYFERKEFLEYLRFFGEERTVGLGEEKTIKVNC